MSTVNPTDKVLVNRAGIDHSAPADMSTVKDTDLLLINRAGVDYKCTFADWKASQTSISTPTITSPAAGATNLGKTPTFTSSAFAGPGTTHASSDWQVTLATDTAFASPVVQSMADAANLVSWGGGPLSVDTDYIVRVRHNGTGGISSAWSAVVAFKTKNSFVAQFDAGNLWGFGAGDTAFSLRAYTAPVKLVGVNISGDYTVPENIAVGVDGKIYRGLASSGNTALSVFTPAGDDNISLAVSYNRDNGGWAFLKSDGSTIGCDGNWPTGTGAASKPIAHPTGVIFVSLGVMGMYCPTIWAADKAGKIWMTSGAEFCGVTLAAQQWVQIPITLPAGEFPVTIAAAQSAGWVPKAVGILCKSGNVYLCGGGTSFATSWNGLTFGPLSAPVQLAGKWAAIAPTHSLFTSPNAGMSGLTSTGELWHTRINVVDWRLISAAGKCRSPLFGGYGVTAAYVLKDDGLIWYTKDSGSTFTKLNYGPAPQTPLSTLGNLPTGFVSDSDRFAIIIP